MSSDPVGVRGPLGHKAPIIAPPPPPPEPTDAEKEEERKKVTTAGDVERRARGRSSTYLTSAGLGDDAVFRRTLLGQ